ncbi:hypothetical protein ACOSQ3_029652 [Xanthoceras sorbifolium]
MAVKHFTTGDAVTKEDFFFNLQHLKRLVVSKFESKSRPPSVFHNSIVKLVIGNAERCASKSKTTSLKLMEF